MYRIDDVTDTYVDALVRDETGMLMFMSCYGRDTALREFMGRVQLGAKSKEGLPTLELRPVGQSGRELVQMGDPRRLEKRMGKLPMNIYGKNVGHLFVFDEAVVQPDYGAKQAWVMTQTKLADADMDKLTWQVIQSLSPVPLLPHWQHAVLPRVKQAGMVVDMSATSNTAMSMPLGNIHALRVRLEDSFAPMVSELIRQRLIGLEAALPAA